MEGKVENKKQGKAKSFFKGLIEKIDKKMQEKASAAPCCCKPANKEKNVCCN